MRRKSLLWLLWHTEQATRKGGILELSRMFQNAAEHQEPQFELGTLLLTFQQFSPGS